MQKSTTLLHQKPLHLSCTPVFLLTLAMVLFAAHPAAAQYAFVPVKFTPQASYHPEFYTNARQSPEVVKEAADETLAVSVTPNPTQGKFFISLKGNGEERVRVIVTDKHGCIVDKHEVPAQANLQLGFWYYPGTYQLHVTQGGVTKTVKLEKLKEDL